MTKIKDANARRKVSHKVLYLVIIVAVALFLIWYLLPPNWYSPDPIPCLPPNKPSFSEMCGEVLSSCCGTTNCGFDTALTIAEYRPDSFCLKSIADTCTLLRLKGCNITALEEGKYNITTDAKEKFIGDCDQFYYDKIKCKYVASEETCTTASNETGKKVTRPCIDENGIRHSEGSCIEKELLGD